LLVFDEGMADDSTSFLNVEVETPATSAAGDNGNAGSQGASANNADCLRARRSSKRKYEDLLPTGLPPWFGVFGEGVRFAAGMDKAISCHTHFCDGQDRYQDSYQSPIPFARKN